MSSTAAHELRAEPAAPARRATGTEPPELAAPIAVMSVADHAVADRAIRGAPPSRVALLALQRSAGNAAVARQLAHYSTRPPGPTPSAQPANSAPAGTAPVAGSLDVDTSVPGFESETRTIDALPRPTALGEPEQIRREPALQGEGTAVQREEEDSGFFASIRRRLSGIGDGIRTGWTSVSGGVGKVVDGLRERGAGALDAIRAAGAGVSNFVRSLATSLPESATAAFTSIRGAVLAPITAIIGGATRVRDAVLRLDADGLAAAWGSIAGLASEAWSAAQAMVGAVGRALSGLWDGAAAGFRSVVDSARAGVNAVVDGLVGLASSATSRLGALWSRVEGFGSDLTSAGSWGGAVIGRIGGALLSGAQRAWSTAQSGWQHARNVAGSVGSSIVSGARGAWNAVSGAATSAWDAAGHAWTRVKVGVGAAADKITGGVRLFVQRVRSFSVTSLAAKLRKYGQVMTGLGTLVADPMSTIEPYAEGIAGKLSAGMPAAASDAVAPPMAAVVRGESRAPAASAVPAPVQRQVTDASTEAVARTTSSRAEMWAGLGAAFTDKWAKLDVKKMALDGLESLVWPWPKIGEELTGIGADMSKAWGNLFSPRNLFDDPLGFFQDLWSDLMKLLDFPLILWRRLNNIALLLLGPITIALTVIGFIGGSLAGTVLGGIAGALGGLGIGAAPGAGAGFGVGGVGGAGLGFGVAMGLGQAFLVSFAAGEVVALTKVLADLFTTRQTRQEKADDYNTAADSGLALGITAILVGLGWIGGRIAAACASVLRGFLPASVLAVIDKFATGVRAARKGGLPTEDRPPPAEDRPPVAEKKPPVVDPQGEYEQPPQQQNPPEHQPSSKEGPPVIDASGKVAQRSDGSFRLNRKNISHSEKIIGEPESTNLKDANREAVAAELAAYKANIDRVYLGEAADEFINGTRGQDMSADVVAVTKKGQYYVYEAKGADITHGLEQLEHTSQQLGSGRVQRQTIVTKEKITTPGYTVENGVLMHQGKPALVGGKPVYIKFTTQDGQ
jgi:hypothetical protein